MRSILGCDRASDGLVVADVDGILRLCPRAEVAELADAHV